MVVCGIQQIGIGVANIEEAFAWYIRAFGCDIKIFDDDGVADLMLFYTNGMPQRRRALMAINLRGGGGFELWQPKIRELRYLSQKPRLGDLGILTCKIRSSDIERSYHHLRHTQGATLLGGIVKNPLGKRHFFLYDPYDNLFEVEEDDYVFSKVDKPTGGVNGAIIGVSNIQKTADFYGEFLGYDVVEYDETGVFDDLKQVNGGNNRLRRYMLKRSAPMQGPLCELMGPSHLEFVYSPDIKPVFLYKDRFWGDPGFIHLCFDVRKIRVFGKLAELMGNPLVCDSGKYFSMGDAHGHFSYVEDPDGTLIELVEAFKIPILKRFDIYLDLRDRDDEKPLPRYMVKALRFLKVKSPR